MQNTLDVKSLSVGFEGRSTLVQAVDDLNLQINPGETLAVLGESGCGKSLSSLALIRLLPLQGVYGLQSAVELGGKDLLSISEKQMRQVRGKRMAMIFQEPMTSLNPVLTIGQQVVEAIGTHLQLSKKAKQTQAIALLKEVELPDVHKRFYQYPHQLSGGQKQRVGIAMALASKPDYLIADEPTTALDVTIQAQILKLLKKVQHKHQMGMLFITHDLAVVKAVADRVCVMYAGQVVEMASVEAFFENPLHPYSNELLQALPSFEKRKQKLHTIPGNVPSLEAMPKGCRFHPRCPYVFSPCSSKAPLLQTSPRTIRCHLYPETASLPQKQQQTAEWEATTTQPTPLLSVENLTVSFVSGNRLLRNQQIFKAVDGISFSLAKGKTLALVGESGCGKSTTARAIIRLIKPSSGYIYYQNQSVSQMKGKALRAYRKKVQIVFQDPFSSMNPRMTVREILAEGMQALGMSARVIQKRTMQVIEQVNLPSTSLSRYPHQFSGGQRQRICIARAIATEPELLICDEPTSALDISVQAQILNLLKTLQLELGLAYLFITHNMGVVAYMSDDVLVMQNGQAVERGSVADIFSQPQTRYTQQLLESVLKI